MIELKSPGELEVMRRAGRIVAELLHSVAQLVQPGARTKDLEAASAAYLKSAGAKPAFLGYRGYPATLCVSVNDEVVHGIPGGRKLMDGDLVSLDAGAVIDGWYADAAVTVPCGRMTPDAKRLTETTALALQRGIATVVSGRRLSDISHAVQSVVEAAGFSVVRDFVGHGIGRALHEDPPIPNFGPPNLGPRLRPGMVLAIEPMVTAGGPDVRVLDDGWTAVTVDHSLAAHFEHTVAVTERGPEVLTALPA
jgi:methionyl aminopeptidase